MLLRVWVLDAPRTGAALPSAGTARARGNAMDVPPWFAMGPPQRSAYLDADAAEEFSSYVSNMIAQGPDAWSWSWPCSGFASVGWFIGTHEYLDPTQGGLINSPTNLQNAINTANGSN